mmetsp:Transcript_14705/g.30231  ORF Transcript_14705/g.30231 Transcript_14705/m.30231 type:complete len:226 (-) Transcript_14705:186-863(-)
MTSPFSLSKTGAQSMERQLKPDMLCLPANLESLVTSGTCTTFFSNAQLPTMLFFMSTVKSSVPLTPDAYLLQSSFFSLSTQKTLHLSASMTSSPWVIRVSSIVSSSLAFFFLSLALRSMKRRQLAPSRQPMVTPMTLPARIIFLDIDRVRCDADMLGGRMPSLATPRSTTPPNNTPDTSEKTCPNAAAVKVAMPSDAPNALSMASPAWIIMKLSIIPNPTIGIMA